MNFPFCPVNPTSLQATYSLLLAPLQSVSLQCIWPRYTLLSLCDKINIALILAFFHSLNLYSFSFTASSILSCHHHLKFCLALLSIPCMHTSTPILASS